MNSMKKTIILICIQIIAIFLCLNTNIVYSEYNNEENIVSVSNWKELKKEIETSNNATKKIIIEANENEALEADSTITIKENQKVLIITQKNVIIKRKSEFKESLLESKGILTLGDSTMNGSITFDGNTEKVISNNPLIKIEKGNLTINNNINIQNNHSTENGGGIAVKDATINIFRRNNTK